MAAYTSWEALRPRLRAVINESTYPVLAATGDFALNSIPRCQLTLAVGRDEVGDRVETVELNQEVKNGRVPVQLYLRLSADRIGPSREFQIFDGDVVAVGTARGDETAGVTVQCEHWLGRLNDTSCLSRASHPQNPAHYTFGAAALVPSEGVGSSALAWTVGGDPERFFASGNIQSDLWGQSIRPWLLALAAQDSFAIDGGRLPGAQANAPAIAALNRIGGSGSPPLALGVTGDGAADILASMRASLTELTTHPGELARHTFWDLIVGRYAPEYLFYLVPRVKSAYCAPVVAGYRTPFREITTGQNIRIEETALVAPPLRGMVIESRLRLTTGGDAPGAAEALGPGGIFLPAGRQSGVIEVRQGPSWCGDLYGGRAGGLARQFQDALTPPSAASVDPAKAAAVAAAKSTRSFLDRYAQAVYVWTVTQGRQAVVQCPLRFDIAPGSTLKVNPGGSKFAADPTLTDPFYGLVVQATWTIDGLAETAGTAFHLGYLHREAEHADEAWTVDNHPLYQAGFAGCTLVDD